MMMVSLTQTLNWCSGVKEGSTDWQRFRCSACFLRVVSDTERDMPPPPEEAVLPVTTDDL